MNIAIVNRPRGRRPALTAVSVDPDHHAGGLDDRVGALAFLQLEVIDRLVGDRRRHHVAAAEIEPDVRRGLALLHLDDRALEDVARADLHGSLRAKLTSGMRLRAAAIRPHQLADRPELAAGRAARVRLDGAIEADELLTGRRDRRPAAAP